MENGAKVSIFAIRCAERVLKFVNSTINPYTLAYVINYLLLCGSIQVCESYTLLYIAHS